MTPTEENKVQPATLQGQTAFRYFGILLVGFAVDLTIAWSTHTFLGLPLIGAAVFGFVVAMTISYFFHEFWTFERESSAVSTKRFVKFTLSSSATLAVRLLLVWLVSGLTSLPGGALVQLGLAYGGSVLVGFLMNRKVVFND